MQLTPQCQLVVDYLRSNRTLTNHIAITFLGIGSLTSRVAELRKLGFDIMRGAAKDFHGKRYIRYVLISEPAN